MIQMKQIGCHKKPTMTRYEKQKLETEPKISNIAFKPGLTSVIWHLASFKHHCNLI